MASSKEDKGVSRIDSGSTHGWFVRGYKNGRTYSKLFSDRKWDGKENALEKAREYRDSLLDELERIPPKPRGRRVQYREQRAPSCMLGVARTSRRGANGVLDECYSVTWRPEPGVQKSTSFSIEKYGEKKAYELAVEHRRDMMREIHGVGTFRKLKQYERDARVDDTMFG